MDGDKEENDAIVYMKTENDDHLSQRTKKVKNFFRWYNSMFEKSLCAIISFLVIPFYYFYVIVFVQPALIDAYHAGTKARIFNLIISAYGVVNIYGNMALSILTNVQVERTVIYEKPEKPIKKNYAYCKVCKVYCPPKSWHCGTCNVCILNRDHHCSILSRCIGLKNMRYYIIYLIYVIFGLAYCNFHFFLYLFFKSDEETPLSLYQIIKSFRVFTVYGILVQIEKRSMTEVEIVIFICNFGLIMWAGWLLCFHGSNMLLGITTNEATKGYHGLGITMKTALLHWRWWKTNIIRVLGTRYYLTVFWPFVSSPLPLYANEEHEC